VKILGEFASSFAPGRVSSIIRSDPDFIRGRSNAGEIWFDQDL
jgi:hypothetical protein